MLYIDQHQREEECHTGARGVQRRVTAHAKIALSVEKNTEPLNAVKGQGARGTRNYQTAKLRLSTGERSPGNRAC